MEIMKIHWGPVTATSKRASWIPSAPKVLFELNSIFWTVHFQPSFFTAIKWKNQMDKLGLSKYRTYKAFSMLAAPKGYWNPSLNFNERHRRSANVHQKDKKSLKKSNDDPSLQHQNEPLRKPSAPKVLFDVDFSFSTVRIKERFLTAIKKAIELDDLGPLQ